MDVFCVSHVNFVFVIPVCSLQPCDHLLGRAGLLALLCVMFSCVLSRSHFVSPAIVLIPDTIVFFLTFFPPDMIR